MPLVSFGGLLLRPKSPASILVMTSMHELEALRVLLEMDDAELGMMR